MRQRIITLANRLPVSISKRKGALTYLQSVGGLATGLSSLQDTHDLIWIGWPGYITDKANERQAIGEKLSTMNMNPLFLTSHEVEYFYEGFSNKTIWPLFHYFSQYAAYNPSFWRVYQKVNRYYAEETLKILKPGDLIWVHDYHLLLTPQLIRAQKPDAAIGFFLHIPFPSYEVFRTMPWRKELITGMLGADLIGFHTYDYVRHFISAAVRLTGLEQAITQLIFQDRIIQVDSFPMGIDFKKFAGAAKQKSVQREVNRMRSRMGGRKVILSIDRLDYSKGILQRLMAYQRFLTRFPQWHEKISLLMVVVPSRSQVDTYRHLRREVDEWVGRINGEFGRIGWSPIEYLYRSFAFDRLAALYQIADVCLVTPFRDGMNLVAKEYIATKENLRGLLVLSEMAGAAEELREAILINPNDVDNIAEALNMALKMPEEQQKERMSKMRQRLQRYDVFRWSNSFIQTLNEAGDVSNTIKKKEITEKERRRLIAEFNSSRNPIIFLDYDGTLRPFEDTPEKAFPDSELLQLLEKLPTRNRCRWVIISGRDHETLEHWFGKMPFYLIAEHGAWIKMRGQPWQIIEELDTSWKEEIGPVLEHFVVRTPGSMVEEKNYSLVWHYRKVDVGLADVRANELKSRLNNLAVQLNLQILQGHKVIEIKNAGVHKGRAASKVLNKIQHDFTLAIGDDWTDEYLFRALPDTAYTIKVGVQATAAKYCLKSVAEVRELLKDMLGLD
ncbi:bifunctional alpha,alpha-trehalose-phosphate synthase (UDP-forming)/trehalose-phosphatase [candidate division KSB1 bacterium]|nr:bifunctional alpha,alpha-trehalose-phosphate synthase (UDP-forming)/trehalose-phosphatase [candidate division KSB1 bacterium]